MKNIQKRNLKRCCRMFHGSIWRILPAVRRRIHRCDCNSNEDTLASEIGVLDPHPRLITTLQKVDPGTNGAVSPLGTGVGMLGALIIGIVAYLLGIVANPLSAVIVSVVSGTVGCFADSILGALFENRDLITNELLT